MIFFIFIILYFFDFQKVWRSGGLGYTFFVKNIFVKKDHIYQKNIFCLGSKKCYISLMTLSRNKRNSVQGWDRTTDLQLNRLLLVPTELPRHCRRFLSTLSVEKLSTPQTHILRKIEIPSQKEKYPLGPFSFLFCILYSVFCFLSLFFSLFRNREPITSRCMT